MYFMILLWKHISGHQMITLHCIYIWFWYVCCLDVYPNPHTVKGDIFSKMTESGMCDWFMVNARITGARINRLLNQSTDGFGTDLITVTWINYKRDKKKLLRSFYDLLCYLTHFMIWFFSTVPVCHTFLPSANIV